MSSVIVWHLKVIDYAVRIFGSSHYGKSAISSWNFAFAVLYCQVYIYFDKQGLHHEQNKIKTIS